MLHAAKRSYCVKPRAIQLFVSLLLFTSYNLLNEFRKGAVRLSISAVSSLNKYCVLELQNSQVSRSSCAVWPYSTYCTCIARVARCRSAVLVQRSPTRSQGQWRKMLPSLNVGHLDTSVARSGEGGHPTVALHTRTQRRFTLASRGCHDDRPPAREQVSRRPEKERAAAGSAAVAIRLPSGDSHYFYTTHRRRRGPNQVKSSPVQKQ